MIESVARWLDGEPVDGNDQMRSFEQALVLIVATEYLCRAIRAGEIPTLLWVATFAVVGAAGLVLVAPLRRVGLVALLGIHAGVMTYEFPASGNHAYLELLLLGLLLLLDPARAEERRLFLRAGRWIVCVILLASGVQKLAWGYYLDGQFLAYKMGTETYRAVLSPLLSDGEAARLAAMNGQPGAGPYLTSSPALVAAARVVVLAEVVLPPLLVIRLTRAAALAASLLLLFAIEAAAREVFFGLVMVNATLLFGPPRLQRAFVPAAAVACGALLASRLGLLPPAVFN